MSNNEKDQGPKRSAAVKALWPSPLREGQRAKGQRILLFDVVGEPKATPRPRAAVRGKGKGARAHIYTPAVAHEWKHEVRAAAAAAIMLEEFTLLEPGIPVSVFLAFRFARPKSHLRTGRHSGKLSPRAPRHHTQKPDKDNLEKAVLDALGEFDGCPRLAWCDDAQVVDGRTSKRWAQPGEAPGVYVALVELPQ